MIFLWNSHLGNRKGEEQHRLTQFDGLVQICQQCQMYELKRKKTTVRIFMGLNH